MATERQMEIKRRRSRKAKLKALRGRYEKSSSSSEKGKILEKMAKVSPSVSKEKFLAPTKK